MFALVMAGGSGTRFWPKSREKHPKQFLKIFGEGTLIQNTIERLLPVIPSENIFVVSTEDQQIEIERQLPNLPRDNFILEPKGKNTAPCIGLAALFLERIDPDAPMVVLPSDHLIKDSTRFEKALKAGAMIASKNDWLVTIGIKPTYPSTGYGYIQFTEQIAQLNDVEAMRVKTFAEKPNLETAKRFISSGDFLWNSGMFVWKVKTILKQIEENLPHLHDGLNEIRKAIATNNQSEVINRVYRQIKSISIDYGVMESAEDVVVLKGEFGWNDLGSWDELYHLSEKDAERNVLLGSHIMKESRGCYVDAPEKCVALIGVEDLVVVDTDDAILICPRNRVQDVKDVVEIAKRKKMNQYL